MKLTSLLSASAAACALAASLTAPAFAQTVISSVRGTVVDQNGAPVAGARVTITDSRTNRTRTTTTSGNGAFNAQNLEVGGPYVVTIQSDRFQGERVEDLFISLGQTAELNFTLEDRSASGDEIVVVASRSVASQLAIGPSSQFDQQTLEAFPSIGRDFRDIVRIDPRVVLDGSDGGDGDSISCLGINNRFNSFTLDGVRVNDGFGLNASGFANRNAPPLPFDAQREVAVEFAPFDVEYGQFTGCNVNVVTKSGTNEFHGSAFAVFNSQSLTGSTLEGVNVNDDPFRDFNWGATLGGPVIKDKLFFFVAYEETDDSNLQDRGPAGAGFGTELAGVSLDEVSQIQDIIENVYGIETGGIATVLPQESRRILTRWDWNITDNHRLAFTYQRLRETNVEEDDFSSTNFTFANTFEEEGTRSELYSARLFSQWSDNFSTEIRASRSDVQDIQGPIGGGEAQSANPIPRIVVGVGNAAIPPASTSTGTQFTVQAGPGFSRTANELRSQVDQIKVKGDYTLRNHKFTLGYELDQLDVFNLFIQNATGTLTFASIANLQQGLTNGATGALNQAGAQSTGTSTTFNSVNVNNGSFVGIQQQGSFDGDPASAAAQFSRSIHSVYAQDEWQVTDRLKAVLGLRYDFYTSGDTPTFNAEFLDRYGFDNTQAFQGLDVFQPRLGLNYEAGETFFGETNFRAGAGLFSGGDPTVWFANSFQNSGGLIGSGVSAGPINASIASLACAAADRDVVNASGQFTGIPACISAQVQGLASLGLSNVVATDPNFQVPTVLRANFGFDHTTNFDGAAGGFFDDWTIQFDVLHSRFRNPVDFVDISLALNTAAGLSGFTIDGRPIYDNIDPNQPGCTATFIGIRQGFANTNAACFTAAREDEILLTNSDLTASSTTIGAAFTKEFSYESPFINRPGSTFVSFGYAWTDSNDVGENFSATAGSQANNTAVFDFLNRPLATSGFERRHNVTAALRIAQEFVEDYESRFNFFFSARSGQPFSLTFDGAPFAPTVGSDNSLLYIPTGLSDPNVVFNFNANATTNQAIAQQYLDFLAQNGADRFAGGTAPRNAFLNDWFLDLDFRFSQDLWTPVKGIGAEFFIDIENLPNLITDEANIFRDFNQRNLDVVDTTVNAAGQYVISGFAPDNLVDLDLDDSLWAVQFGLRISF